MSKKSIGFTNVQDRTTGKVYRVGIEVDFHEVIRLYAQRAIGNKNRKARVANGAIAIIAQEVGS